MPRLITPYKVNESAIPDYRPCPINIKVRGDLVNQHGQWKQFDLEIKNMLNTEVYRYIKSIIASELPGYSIVCFWAVASS